jgi:hypothetical protein
MIYFLLHIFGSLNTNNLSSHSEHFLNRSYVIGIVYQINHYLALISHPGPMFHESKRMQGTFRSGTRSLNMLETMTLKRLGLTSPGHLVIYRQQLRPGLKSL